MSSSLLILEHHFIIQALVQWVLLHKWIQLTAETAGENAVRRHWDHTRHLVGHHLLLSLRLEHIFAVISSRHHRVIVHIGLHRWHSRLCWENGILLCVFAPLLLLLLLLLVSIDWVLPGVLRSVMTGLLTLQTEIVLMYGHFPWHIFGDSLMSRLIQI